MKTLVLHMSLAHRDWLPSGQLPAGHALTVQHTLHMLLGVGLAHPTLCCAEDSVKHLLVLSVGWLRQDAGGRNKPHEQVAS